MAFQIKNFGSIAAGAVNWFKSAQSAVTDFSIGSVARTMIEAVAAEIDELYIRMLIGLQEAIPVSVYNSFGFGQLAAVSAGGMVTFSAGSPVAAGLLIPAGTTVQAPAGLVTYSTLADAVILTGTSSISALVAANTPGMIGNAGTATITQMVTPITGVVTCSNAAPFVNGADAETDAERKTRFQAYISTLARGTSAALIYGAQTSTIVNSFGVITEHVATASVQEPWITDITQPVSLVNLYIHNGASSTSSALVTATQAIINGYYDINGNAVAGWKAAGVKVVVIAATDVPVPVTAVVGIATGYDGPTVRAAVQNAQSTYIAALPVAAMVIKADLIAIAIRDVPGVTNIVMSAPAADVMITASQKAIPGTFTLS